MKKLVFLLFLALNVSYSQDFDYLDVNQGFETDEIVYLFGDNVKLRTSPSVDSKVLDLLKIGDSLKIIEKTDSHYVYNGLNTRWYKVEHNNKQGYVVGGLISVTEKKAENARFLFGFEIVDEKLYTITRVLLNSKKNYLENKTEYLGDNYGFTINLYDNKGVKGINNIVFIRYLPESCGANSGGCYLFLDDNNLYKVIDVTSSADIGFWEDENLIFPNDPKGEENKIIYFKENGQSHENDNPEIQPIWEKSDIIKVNVKWINNKLEPNPKTVVNDINKE